MENLILSYGSVIYELDHKIVNIRCKGYIPQDKLFAIAEYGYEMIVFYKVKVCLINIQEIKIYPLAFEEYLRNIWYAKLASAGIGHIAFIAPENVFGKNSMNHVHASKDLEKIQRRYFKDEPGAKAWLLTSTGNSVEHEPQRIDNIK